MPTHHARAVMIGSDVRARRHRQHRESLADLREVPPNAGNAEDWLTLFVKAICPYVSFPSRLDR